MVLIYPVSDDDTFEYEIDSFDALDYIRDKYDNDTLINMFQDELALEPEWGDPEYEQDDILDDIILDNLYVFEDELYDEFYNAAMKEYAEEDHISRNSWEYNGVSPRDFM